MAMDEIRIIQQEVRDAVYEDIQKQNNPKFFINDKVVNSCWHEIWRWINTASIGPHLLKYGVVQDPIELETLQNPYFTTRQKADQLLTLVTRSGPCGCHVLYMCIRDDDENPLGHASAIEMLANKARHMGIQPPTFLSVPVSLDGIRGRRTDEERLEDDNNDHDSDDDHPQGQSLPSNTSNPNSSNSALSPVNPNLSTPHEETRHWPLSSSNHEQPSTPVSSNGASVLYGVTSLDKTPLGNPQRGYSYPIPAMPSLSSSTSSSDSLQSNISVRGTNTAHNGDSLRGTRAGDTSVTSDSPRQGPLRSNSLPSCTGSIIMKKIQDLIQCFEKPLEDKLRQIGIDIQLTGANDFEHITDLVDELLEFITACLNSRASGVTSGALIAGVESDGNQYFLNGVPVLWSNLEMLHGHLKKKMRDCLVIKKSAGQSVCTQEDTEAIMRMVHFARHEVNVQSSNPGSDTDITSVIVLVVIPDWHVCQNQLFVVKNGRKQQVYQRLGGHTALVKGPQILEAQEKLASEFDTFCKIK